MLGVPTTRPGPPETPIGVPPAVRLVLAELQEVRAVVLPHDHRAEEAVVFDNIFETPVFN